ncbi:MAG: hypothetical protein HYZ29_27280 [Myxococcales bacterium]|nr:hypothetical protein [Myxococcales bacterium]
MNIEVIAAEDSAIGMICLRRREVAGDPGHSAFEITVDHQFLMSSLVTASERALAVRALELCTAAAPRVLVGGLGLGYTAQAALASPRAALVEVIELLPAVIGWFERGLIPLASELRADPRLVVRQGDVYQHLLAPPTTRYDAILIDVDTSPERRLGEVSVPFYGEAGLRACAEHLAPGGVLGVWSAAESPEFEQALAAVFARWRAEPVDFENAMLGEPETNWLYFGGKPGD